MLLVSKTVRSTCLLGLLLLAQVVNSKIQAPTDSNFPSKDGEKVQESFNIKVGFAGHSKMHSSKLGKQPAHNGETQHGSDASSQAASESESSSENIVADIDDLDPDPTDEEEDISSSSSSSSSPSW
jgi:hypothetical protein